MLPERKPGQEYRSVASMDDTVEIDMSELFAGEEPEEAGSACAYVQEYLDFGWVGMANEQ